MRHVLYMLSSVFIAISLECYVVIFLIRFQVTPGKKGLRSFVDRREISEALKWVAFAFALFSGIFWTLADGFFAKEQYMLAMMPAFVVLVPAFARLAGAKWAAKEKVEELIIYAQDYVLETKLPPVVGGTLPPISMAHCKDKEIRFNAAVPSKPVDIRAYCVKNGDYYVCVGYDMLQPAEPKKKTLKEKTEVIHTAVIVIMAIIIPIVCAPMFLWTMEHGGGDNPYMDYLAVSFCVICFGGCRKKFRNATESLAKVMKFMFVGMYYLMLFCLLILLLQTVI